MFYIERIRKLYTQQRCKTPPSKKKKKKKDEASWVGYKIASDD